MYLLKPKRTYYLKFVTTETQAFQETAHWFNNFARPLSAASLRHWYRRKFYVVIRCVISITQTWLTHLKWIQILSCRTFFGINLGLFKIVNDSLDILRIRNSLMEKWMSYIWYAAKHFKVIPDECFKYFIREIIKCGEFYPLENHMLFRNN